MSMEKKFFLLAAFFILVQINIFSQESGNGDTESGEGIFYPIKIEPETQGTDAEKKKETLFVRSSSARLGIGFNTGTGFEPYRAFGQAWFSMDAGRWSLDVGAKASYLSFDFSTDMIFWPLCFTHVRAGVGMMYNINLYGNMGLNNNFLPGLYFQYRTGGVFSVKAFVNYLCKLRTVYSIADTQPFLQNNSLGAGLAFSFSLPGNFDINLTVATYEMFRVMVVGTPSVSLDVGYRIKNWQFGLGAVARFIDPFILSAHFYDAEFNGWVRYIFNHEERKK